MTIRFILLYFYCAFSFCYGNNVSGLDNWTRAKDEKSIEAYFVSFNSKTNQVTLKMKNGQSHTIELSVLIPKHQTRAKELHMKMVHKEKETGKPKIESTALKEAGGEMVHIYKPVNHMRNLPTNRPPPILFLYSPSGKSLNIVKRLKPAAEELGWILVGVDAYSNSKVKRNRSKVMQNTKATFNWAKENLSFDSNKIVFGGMSGGGWWSYQSASEVTNKTAGIIAFGGWMSKMYNQKYSRRMAVAIVNGDKDKGALLYEEKDSDFLKKKARAEVKVFHFPGGHVLAPSDIALKAARWIHETKNFDDN